MENSFLNSRNQFSSKAVFILIAVSVLLSVFVVVGMAQAANPGDHCNTTADCGTGMDCYYNRCLKKAFSSCSTSADCAGEYTSIMGCFSGQCLGRHGYPCGDVRDDPVCAPGFHCDITTSIGYHYCEGNEGGTPNLIISKSVNKNTANPGDEVVYTLTYANVGEGSANGVIVKDTFNYINQQYLTFISATPAPTSGTDTWSIGTLNAGQSGQITIRAGVSTSVPIGTTEIKNRATIQSNEVSLIYSNCANFFVTRAGVPSLSITKSVSKSSASPGESIVYTLNYKNTGQATATNVIIKDPFINLNQNYLTFISATPNPTSGTDTWNIGTLGPDFIGQINIVARISNSVSGNIEIQNRANIDSNETDLQYSNYVSTYVSGIASLDIDKLVRNISTGSGFVESVSARPNDEIEFSLVVRSTGNNTVNNVKVWDNLPYRLNYISGTTTVDGSYKEDGITSGGIYIGDLSAGQTKTIKFRARVADETMFNVGFTTLTNYGYTSGNGVALVYDSATVEVRKDSGCSASLHINKQVRNITQGFGYWTDIVSANPGNEIEVLIRINSVGNETAENSRVRDQLPSHLNYISGSTTVNGSYKEDGIVSGNGIYLGNFYVGDSKEIKFRIRVGSADEFSASSTTLTNYAYTWGDKTCGEINDSAQIIVNKQQTSTYLLSISKLGRNLSRGQVELLDSFLASPSDELEFSIQITNVGNTDLSNVKVWDSLPANISIITGSTTIDGVSWGGDVIGAGLSLGSLTAGQTKTIKFRVRVESADKFGAGSTTLINTAYAIATNVFQISDSASVIIYKPGEVLGAALVKTGANSMALIFLMIISGLISFFFYCRLREERLLEILNSNRGNRFYRWLIKSYFRLKLLFTVKAMRFKKVYW
ncbi:MAG: hypothetical protein ACOZAL_01425 [Patescibacteria group bacterium]